MPDNKRETQSDAPLSGASLDKTQTKNSDVIMFHHLRVNVLVLEYTQGIEQKQFVSDRMRFDATVRNVELIGEAATHGA